MLTRADKPFARVPPVTGGSDYAIFRTLSTCLEQRIPAALLVVVASEGSSPGRAGMKMVITRETPLAGSVGGGLGEYRMVEMARSPLQQEIPSPVMHRQQHHPHATDDASSGMICGGEQTILIYPLCPADLTHLQAVLAALQQNNPVLLTLSRHGMTCEPQTCHVHPARLLRQDRQGGWHYQESLGRLPVAFLVGGGHVSLALSSLLAMLDFRVVVLEQRSHVTTCVQNAWAHEKHQVDYAAIGHHVVSGEDHYVIIMTHTHRYDEQVLRQLLGKRLAYLGLLGSKRKIALLLQHLQGQFSAEALRQLRAPAGIPIHSHSAAEIAVSIAAEMISVRANYCSSTN